MPAGAAMAPLRESCYPSRFTHRLRAGLANCVPSGESGEICSSEFFLWLSSEVFQGLSGERG